MSNKLSFCMLATLFFCFSCNEFEPKTSTTDTTLTSTTSSTTTTTVYRLSEVRYLSVERFANSLKLSWIKDNYDSVKIYYSTEYEKANKDSGVFLKDLTSDSSYLHENLSANFKYYYSIYTIFEGKYSSPARIDSMTLNKSVKKIHFYDETNSQKVEINLKNGITAPMNDDGGRWFSYLSENTEEILFNFSSDKNIFPSENKYFRNSFDEIWIKDGIIYTYDPEKNNKPLNELIILTLNLHTYQEASADTKLDKVADVIAKLKPDFVCFQECAQHKNASVIDDPRAAGQIGIDKIKTGTKEKETNMAYYISKRLYEIHKLTYNYYWSWAHYGWDVWEEGVAILTPYVIEKSENRYISTQKTTSSIDSRKAVFIQATVPNIGKVNLFSVHTSWGTPQAAQFDELRKFINEKESETSPVASIVGGDFNANVGETGYLRITSFNGGDKMTDAYYTANNGGYKDTTMMGDAHNGISRIDYIFYKYSDKITPKTGQIYFIPLVDKEYLGGQVSDHNGVIIRFKVD